VPAVVDFSTPHVGYLLGAPVAQADQQGQAPCSTLGDETTPCPELMKTADGGRSWRVVKTGSRGLLAMAFTSPSVGVLAAADCKGKAPSAHAPLTGCSGDVYRTGNGGASWHFVLRTIEPVLALGEAGDRAWAVEASATTFRRPDSPGWLKVLKSNDVLSHWAVVSTVAGSAFGEPVPSGLSVALRVASGSLAAMVVFSLADCAMMGCYFDDLLTTADGGRTWARSSLNYTGPGCPPGVSGFSDDAAGRMVVFTTSACPGQADQALVSADQGAHWTTARHFGFGAVPSAMALSATGTGWAVEGGTVLLSRDRGTRWAQVWPAPAPTAGIDFLGPRTGYGIGDEADPGALLQTDDGGQYWRQVYSLGAEVAEVDFVGARAGWALAFPLRVGGGLAELLETADGGSSWSVVRLPRWAALALSQAEADAPEAEQLTLVRAVSASQVLVVLPPRAPQGPQAGTPEALLTTSDAGKMWRTSPLRGWDAAEGTAQFVTRSAGWAVGSRSGRPVVLRTPDGGQRWVATGDGPTSSTASVGVALGGLYGYALDGMQERKSGSRVNGP
jgi:photosystem II stability/assembly factor-like uncharacterized protein